MKGMCYTMNLKYMDRITEIEALKLFELDLYELSCRAMKIRYKYNPENFVTYVVDANPNYTNICVTECSFCAFYRRRNAPDAYTYSIDELINKFREFRKLGVDTILLQGGHNPAIPFEYYLELIRKTRKEIPEVNPHFFSAAEIYFFSQIYKKPVSYILEKLFEAGQRTLPGGGAEILSDRVRNIISPKKVDSKTWISVHRIAHKIGFRSTATMMYGHVETLSEIIEHLKLLRDLQDETGGFTAFIPWSYKEGKSLYHKMPERKASATLYLKIIAVARIYLDNFKHIQASWFSEGKKLGQIALHFGADDFGGTLFEENVHKEAGFVNKTTIEEVETLIKEAGFIPKRRNTLYEEVKSAFLLTYIFINLAVVLKSVLEKFIA